MTIKTVFISVTDLVLFYGILTMNFAFMWGEVYDFLVFSNYWKGLLNEQNYIAIQPTTLFHCCLNVVLDIFVDCYLGHLILLASFMLGGIVLLHLVAIFKSYSRRFSILSKHISWISTIHKFTWAFFVTANHIELYI